MANILEKTGVVNGKGRSLEAQMFRCLDAWQEQVRRRKRKQEKQRKQAKEKKEILQEKQGGKLGLFFRGVLMYNRQKGTRDREQETSKR